MLSLDELLSLDVLSMMNVDSPPAFSDGRYLCLLAPPQVRAIKWDIERVCARESRGEYVPHDERHPPITASEIRARRAT